MNGVFKKANIFNEQNICMQTQVNNKVATSNFIAHIYLCE